MSQTQSLSYSSYKLFYNLRKNWEESILDCLRGESSLMHDGFLSLQANKSIFFNEQHYVI